MLISNLFDFSGYEKESPFYDDKDKKVFCKMKDELNGEVKEEFVGLSENKERRKEEGKGSKEECSQKRH